MVRHLEHAADVGGLTLVEEEIGGGCVVVGAVTALEEVEGDERVEKVVGGSWMQTEACAEVGQGFGMFGELGEELHFDRTEQRLRGPEAEAYLHDVVWA